MKKRKWFKLASLLLAAAVAGTGCQGQTGNEQGQKKEGSTVQIEFWAAPNPTQQAFWKKMADRYMEEHQNVKIKVSPMPESPSSEAGIQSAIAAGNAPVISENISRGFAAQLSDSRAIVPLDQFEGFDDLIAKRQMKSTISTWKFADGHQYVLPIYSNAMLFGWRIDILKELGYNAPPKTYSEVLEVGKKLKEKYPNKFLWARADLVKPTWWARWFDFFMIYNAASNGTHFIDGNKLSADRDAGVKTLQFFADLSKNQLVLTKETKDPFESGTSLMSDLGPWTFPYWAEKFPEMKFNEKYVLSMPPVPDGMDPSQAKTFADTKGLVIYASATKEQQQAAFDFIKWVYSDPQNDLEWLKETNLPPARDDLSTNEAFVSYFEENPQLKLYAENIPNALPPMDNAQMVEIQELIGKQALNPVVKGEKTPEKAWKDMEKAIDGVLK
ncbi:extracellular solute-binding protein [Geobacillus thermoleovorans]|uniref:extracellular solute-binding protein n=1 Tax=Geobacillus thermoleovorans TaxID=33941 RepID=UPI003DA4E9BE